MAHLIESTGHLALVAGVAATRNNALVRELESDPQLQDWLEEFGISAAEAARIQPSYCVTPGPDCFCYYESGNDTILEGTLTAQLDGYVWQLEVEAIYGSGGSVTVGQLVEVSGSAIEGATVLARPLPESPEQYTIGLPVQPGDVVEVPCEISTGQPPLPKPIAIQAMLLPADECADLLAEEDEYWSTTTCWGEGYDEGHAEETPLRPDDGCNLLRDAVSMECVVALLAAILLRQHRASKRSTARRSRSRLRRRTSAQRSAKRDSSV